jgi:chromosome segregation ATPase
MSWTDFLSILIPVTVALVATIPGFLAYANTRRKAPAEAAEIITGAAANIVEKLEKHITGLEAKIDALIGELDKTKDGLRSTKVELALTQGKLDLMQGTITTLQGENARLSDFAETCKTTIRELSALLRENGVQNNTDGLGPS